MDTLVLQLSFAAATLFQHGKDALETGDSVSAAGGGAGHWTYCVRDEVSSKSADRRIAATREVPGKSGQLRLAGQRRSAADLSIPRHRDRSALSRLCADDLGRQGKAAAGSDAA